MSKVMVVRLCSYNEEVSVWVRLMVVRLCSYNEEVSLWVRLMVVRLCSYNNEVSLWVRLMVVRLKITPRNCLRCNHDLKSQSRPFLIHKLLPNFRIFNRSITTVEQELSTLLEYPSSFPLCFCVVRFCSIFSFLCSVL